MPRYPGLPCAAALALCLAAIPPRVAAQEAPGPGLTPMGAERAGNPAGTIPAWEGGIARPPDGYRDGDFPPDPFAADRPLFTIDAGNAARYRDSLTPGQLAMLARYPTWKMRVFPTRRTAAFPEAHYRETVANAGRARLAEGGNGVTGTSGGIPFPVPKDGLEAIWNHLLRYRGDCLAMTWGQAPVQRDGSFLLVRMENDFVFHYGNLSVPAGERLPNRHVDFLQVTTAPARLAGQVLLVQEHVDQVADPRSAWTYTPGQRRLRLAPNVAYDNPGTAADGLRTNDDFMMYNGAPDRYTWTLLGKREVYVPYNAHALLERNRRPEDAIRPFHLNPDLARYELHRVWVVEATLKAGVSHVYARRTFYLDEDSWNAMVVDKYDARGELWRVAELHPIVLPGFPMLFPMVEAHHDLQSGRYLVAGLREPGNQPLYERKACRGPLGPEDARAKGVR